MSDSFAHLPGERWLPISEFPDYDISSAGRVASRRRGVPRLLAPRPAAAAKPGNLPYLYVALYGPGRADRSVHSLVLTTFVGPRPHSDSEARHLNSDPQDNRLENLAWGTKAENLQDKIDNRTHCKNGHELGGWSKNGTKRTRRCNPCRMEAYYAAK